MFEFHSSVSYSFNPLCHGAAQTDDSSNEAFGLFGLEHKEAALLGGTGEMCAKTSKEMSHEKIKLSKKKKKAKINDLLHAIEGGFAFIYS